MGSSFMALNTRYGRVILNLAHIVAMKTDGPSVVVQIHHRDEPLTLWYTGPEDAAHALAEIEKGLMQ